MKTGVVVGIGLGVLAIGGIIYAVSRKQNQQNQRGGIMNQSNPIGQGNGFSPQNNTPQQNVVDEDMTTAEIISKWKSNKDEIKPTCGRRRILGQKKQDWLECVENFNTVSNFDGGSNEVEVGDMLTDLS